VSADAPGQLGAAARAEVLAEALPYIRRFWGKVVVVKHGGHAISPSTGGSDETAAEATLASFAQDVVLMSSVGMRPVVVHGGGPQIGELMTRLGKEPEFRGGLRVTDADTLDIARMVLVGKVNRDIVGAINVHGPLAVGLSGEDAGLITASAHPDELGFVGEVKAVNPAILERLLAQDLIPVVATIGSDASGQAYNINADTAAGAVAEVLGAEKLVYLTNVEGLRRRLDDPASLVHTTDAEDLEAMMAEGILSDGMIPKAAACVRAVRAGVRQAHILDGRLPHALLLEVYTREGIGTLVSQ
jgi:acetylglutamate kinase